MPSSHGHKRGFVERVRRRITDAMKVQSGDTTHKRLDAVLDFGYENEAQCLSGQLGAILRHQLATPLYVDMAYLDPDEVRQIEALAGVHNLLLTSLRDLLHAPEPSLSLLAAAKSYAKRSRLGRGATLPKEVATILYFAAIAVATVKCRASISSLSTDRVLMGLDWSLEQDWIDQRLQALLQECRDEIARSAPYGNAESGTSPDPAGIVGETPVDPLDGHWNPLVL